MLFLTLTCTLLVKLSEYCHDSSKYKSPISLEEIDVPFQECPETINFAKTSFNTSYEALLNYPYRTLRIDGGMTFIVNDVIRGDILSMLDVVGATLILNLKKGVDSISGDIRIEQENGSKLIVNGGSLRLNKQKLIRIIHTNDVHCHYAEDPAEKFIGLPKYQSYLINERQKAKENGYSVLAFDSGDFIQGMPLCNLNNGTVGKNALKLIKHDAFTLGNHEFDFKHDNFFKYTEEFRKENYPLVCTNIDDQTPGEKSFLNPYIIKYVDGIKVGIFGMVTPYTNVTTNPVQVKDVHFNDDVIQLSKDAVSYLRNEMKCDIVLLICHLGYQEGEINSNVLADGFDGIDAIIDGHSHTDLSEGVYRLKNDYQTMIVQAGCYLKFIGNLDLLVDYETKKIVGKKASLLDYDYFANYTEDQNMKKFVDNATAEVEKFTKQIVGKTNIFLDSDREKVRKTGDSDLVDFITTAMLRSAPMANISYLNGGGARASIPIGDISWGQVISVLPFTNLIYVIEMNGTVLKEMITYGTRVFGQEQFGGFPCLSGISYKIDLNKNATDVGRITEMKIVGIDGTLNHSVVDSEKYYVAMPDFTHDGGDGYTMVKGLPKITHTDVIFEATIDLIKSLPSATITGNEGFLKYTRANVVNKTTPLKLKYPSRIKKIVRAADNAPSIQIPQGALNLLDYSYQNQNITFYHFTAEASSYIASNVNSLKSILGPKGLENMGYVGTNGTLIFNSVKSLVVAGSAEETPNELNNALGKTIPISKCSIFQKNSPTGECVSNSAFTAVFAVMIVFIITTIVAVIVLVLSMKNSHDDSGSANP